ncbi:hypothetical protein CDCO157_1633 [Escherichia coli Xuzhou21]|nr:hypothetical protein CDCO157_1633 [Escherichia coli Xuzhou21]OVC91347.1 hypothetical protein UQ13_28350 [Escherichia coli]
MRDMSGAFNNDGRGISPLIATSWERCNKLMKRETWNVPHQAQGLTPLPSPTTSARIIKVLLPLRFSTFNVVNVPAVDPWLAKSTVEWLSASVSRLELLVTFQTLLFIATSSFPPLTLSLREEPVQTDPGCISRLISPPLERTLPLISIRPEALMRLAA